MDKFWFFHIFYFVICWEIVNSLSNRTKPGKCDQFLTTTEERTSTDSEPILSLEPSSIKGLVTVQIKICVSELDYKEIVVQARDLTNPKIVIGRFLPTEFELVSCREGNDTVIISSPPFKGNYSLDWVPPRYFDGSIVFTALVVFSSRSVPRVVQSNSLKVSRQQEKRISQSIYEGCGSIKTCFGMPDSCLVDETCEAIVAITPKDIDYEFTLQSFYESQAYVAVGISLDNRMGDDSVVSCIVQSDAIELRSSWTSSSPYSDSRDDVPQNHSHLLDSSYQDGVISCTFSHVAQFVVKGQAFDLTEHPYFLLIAAGTQVQENSLSVHNLGRLPSSKAILLSENRVLGGTSKLLLRLHGALMIAAWIGTAPLAIMLARYFKQSFKGSQLCGTAQWFAWHRALMISTCILTIVGFSIIFIELGGWSSNENPHGILGTITVILCVMQVMIAFFRPALDAKTRPFFNWGHFLSGNIMHILAITTIILAVSLTKAELPEFVMGIVIAFIAFYISMHAMFTMTDFASFERYEKFEDEIHVAKGENKLDKQALIKNLLLLLFFVVVLLFAISLIIITIAAPIK